MCDHYQKSNIEPCGLAEVFLVPEWNVKRGGVIVLSEHVSYEEAAMIEPLACCIKAFNSAGIRGKDSIAVIGAGPAGIMHIILAEHAGAEPIIAVDVNEFRLKFASSIGADITLDARDSDITTKVKAVTESRGVDVAIVATSNTNALLSALNMVRKGGKVILFGVPPKGSTVSIDLNHVFNNEIKIVPSLAASDYDTREAFNLIESKRIDIARVITHRFPLDDARDAIECAHKATDAMKVVVVT